MNDVIKIPAKSDPDVFLRVIPGHFASDRFHINYYIDMTMLKTRYTEVRAVAQAMTKKYVNRIDATGFNGFGANYEAMASMSANKAPIDTIICMDGCEAIGAFVAEELANLGVGTNTGHKSTYIVSPEFDSSGQMVVRDNIKKMIKGRHVLVVLASAMSGRTISKSLRCIKEYGGIVEGISVIFSVIDRIEGFPVHSVFSIEDVEGFKLSDAEECQMCKDHKPLDAIVNSYGYSIL